VKLCDFGFSTDLKTLNFTKKGTSGYMAPEIYQTSKGYEGQRADFFALGVILFIFEFGIPPFTIPSNGDLFYRFLMRGPQMRKFFFKVHPATKD